MDYQLTERERALIEEVRAYGEKYFSDDAIARWRHEQGLPDEVVEAFVKLDFQGYGVIHRRNHVNYDLLAQVLVLEELARVAGAALPFHIDLFQLQILEAFARPEQTDPIRIEYQNTGRLKFAIAVSEPTGGSDTWNMKTTVRSEGGKLLLNGRKEYVNNGEYVPYLFVMALDEDKPVDAHGHKQLSMWLIPSNLPGIRIVHVQKIGQQIIPFASIAFENVELDESYRLDVDGVEGFKQLFHLFEYGRLFVCASALGEAQAAMDDAVAWARTREAFGKTIGQFQQIQQMLVDMQVKLVNMRNMVYGVAREMDAGTHERLSTALMKRYVPQAATEVASDAMQILGGRGYLKMTRVSSIWEDCRGFQIADGTDQIMVHIAAPLILKQGEDGPANAVDEESADRD
jgi:alkylation response protein AidB-like acyl-CoA dehydrogenase